MPIISDLKNNYYFGHKVFQKKYFSLFSIFLETQNWPYLENKILFQNSVRWIFCPLCGVYVYQILAPSHYPSYLNLTFCAFFWGERKHSFCMICPITQERYTVRWYGIYTTLQAMFRAFQRYHHVCENILPPSRTWPFNLTGRHFGGPRMQNTHRFFQTEDGFDWNDIIEVFSVY
jgi:hypothetical protein